MKLFNFLCKKKKTLIEKIKEMKIMTLNLAQLGIYMQYKIQII